MGESAARNAGRSMKPLVTPFYIASSHTETLGSPVSVSGSDHSPYASQIRPTPRDGFTPSQDVGKPNSSVQEQVEMEPFSNFPPAISPFAPCGSTQPIREDDRQMWPTHGTHGIRWAKSEHASPIEDSEIPGPKLRRSSLKTCELGETGLGFPGCFVLVPTADSPPDSESQSGDGPEPSLVSAKKSVRRPMEEAERAAIKLNRKLGVCLRCKIFKERCRGGFPCDRCRSLRHWKNICVSAHFAHRSIFSRGLWKARLVPSLRNVAEWVPLDSNSIEYIHVSNGYAPSIAVAVQQFKPVDSTLLDHVLWRELRKTDFARIPSSAIAVSSEIPFDKLDVYFGDHILPLVNEIQMLAGSQAHEQTFAQTLRAACDYSSANPENGYLVRKALRLWAAQIIYFKGVWRISGQNKVGMFPIQDPKSKLYGITPLPRLANQQLDARVEEWMAQREQGLLTELQTKIFKRNSTDWFTIYLTLFVTLSTLEMDTWSLKTWATDSKDLLDRIEAMDLRHPNESRRAWLWPLADNPETLVDRNTFLTETLVAHFRSVTKGFVPFTLDWYSDQAVVMAGGEQYALEYMRTIGQQVKASDRQLRERIVAEYSREDINSLKLSYSAKLMVGEDS
ncbi:unnamed protein product [Tuber melanosporum]|uniref:(Perigord truffle) hypothetical protein n=1 Tax=Tuber melanosporum (strain Mel28) TaxID=656061 RepID=D5GC30_TUBMM|nr:uncharacterized protein GSTUM_00000541001 [Tuber melanosporum]CAZ82073.1 unnamed protein product [Tuber melanosporum]